MAKFNGSEGGEISLKVAAAWTANYRRRSNNPKRARAHYFGRDLINRILAQEGCVGIRMYYGIQPTITDSGETLTDEDEGARQLILVGVNEEGNDIEDGILGDRSSVCPPECSEPDELNP